MASRYQLTVTELLQGLGHLAIMSARSHVLRRMGVMAAGTGSMLRSDRRAHNYLQHGTRASECESESPWKTSGKFKFAADEDEVLQPSASMMRTRPLNGWSSILPTWYNPCRHPTQARRDLGRINAGESEVRSVMLIATIFSLFPGHSKIHLQGTTSPDPWRKYRSEAEDLRGVKVRMKIPFRAR